MMDTPLLIHGSYRLSSELLTHMSSYLSDRQDRSYLFEHSTHHISALIDLD
jgi:transcriptional regulator of aromatic amino acid metabolism